MLTPINVKPHAKEVMTIKTQSRAQQLSKMLHSLYQGFQVLTFLNKQSSMLTDQLASKPSADLYLHCSKNKVNLG